MRNQCAEVKQTCTLTTGSKRVPTSVKNFNPAFQRAFASHQVDIGRSRVPEADVVRAAVAHTAAVLEEKPVRARGAVRPVAAGPARSLAMLALPRLPLAIVRFRTQVATRVQELEEAPGARSDALTHLQLVPSVAHPAIAPAKVTLETVLVIAGNAASTGVSNVANIAGIPAFVPGASWDIFGLKEQVFGAAGTIVSRTNAIQARLSTFRAKVPFPEVSHWTGIHTGSVGALNIQGVCVRWALRDTLVLVQTHVADATEARIRRKPVGARRTHLCARFADVSLQVPVETRVALCHTASVSQQKTWLPALDAARGELGTIHAGVVAIQTSSGGRVGVLT